MRHGKKFNHLKRKPAHRKAMLANMACSLIEHKRINTTVAKAKALKKYIEPLVTKSKTDTTHSRRVVFSYLKQKEAVTELFREVSAKVASRPGGYTRIIRTGNRLGDNADMCMIELVDFNDVYTTEKKAKKKRSRRGGKKSGAGAAATVAAAAGTVAAKAEEAATDAAEAASEAAEEVKEIASETVEAVEETTEEVSEAVEEVKDETEDSSEEKNAKDEEE
ncbi:MAG: 50S ribosomal protein L17 [Flavobacteriales bacterium]|nr:50S ribosomal protein L17 [Flavobacteriales bacterium]